MILRRYMIRQVAVNTLLVVGFLMALMLGGRLVRFFGRAVEGRLDVSLIFTIIGYNVPFLLELILPLAFFIALMLVFGRLYVDHEMAVINGCGMSRGRLARLMMPLFVVLFVFEAWLAMVGKPWGLRQSEAIWYQQGLRSAFDLIRPKQFISSNNFHLYVGSLSEDKKQLQDVILIQTADTSRGQSEGKAETTAESKETDGQESIKAGQDKKAGNPFLGSSKRDTVILAKTAVQVGDVGQAGKAQLDLYHGRRYEVGADSLRYNQVGFERYRISLTKPTDDERNEVNVETQSLAKVWQSAVTSPQVKPNLVAQAELGYRFALPWLMIIAPMLAVPLAEVRPRQGRWLRLLPSILLFVSCALAIISLKNPIGKGKFGVWAYAWVILGFMGFALYLNWRSRLHHRIRLRYFSKKDRVLPIKDNGSE